MTKFIETRKYNSLQDPGNRAKKVEVSSLLGDEEISESVRQSVDWIPIECSVDGSKEVIRLFKEIKNKKFDEEISTKEIRLIGFTDEQQIILGFVVKDDADEISYTATGIYSFDSIFLDDLFCLDKFAGYCLRTNQKDLLIDNITRLLNDSHEVTKKYRFIEGKKEDEVYLRALTSSRYKNYDNNIVLYLSLNAIHRYSEKTKNPAYIEQALITDSSLVMNVKLKNKISLGKRYQVEIGIKVSNSEIREGAILFDLIYTIVDSNGMRSTAIGDSILDVRHNLNMQMVKRRLRFLDDLETKSKDFLQGIDEVRLTEKLDADQLSVIFNKLAGPRVRGVGADVKQELNRISGDITENTYSLLELFNKLEAIDASVDDKTYIQRRFSDFLTKGFK